MSASTTMAGRDWLRLLYLSVLWGASFLFYKILASRLPPFTTVLGRVAIAAVALNLVLWARGVPLGVPRRLWGRFAVLAALNNAIPFTLFAWGEQRVASGTAAILNAMTPIFTILVAGLVLRTERITAPRLAGIACGFTGVAVLVGPDALLGQDVLGQLACLAAAVSYGFGVPYGRRITGIAPERMAAGQLLFSSLIMLPLVLLVDRPWSLALPDAAGWGALLGLALPCTALAYVTFFGILARAGASNLVLVTFLVPVTSLLLGAAVLAEPLTWQQAAGMALIATGLAAIDGRVFRVGRASTA